MSSIIIGGSVCTGGSTPAVGSSVGYYQTIAQLRANLSIFTTGVSVLVAGNQASNDTLGGIYTWDPLSTATDDGYSVIQQTNQTGAGRWILNNGLVNINGVWTNSDAGSISGVRNNVTTGRVLGTNYTNRNGKPMPIAVTGFMGVAGYVTLTAGGKTIDVSNFTNVQNFGVNGIILPGEVYSVAASGGTVAGLIWTEVF